jgi:hypothetical protein
LNQRSNDAFKHRLGLLQHFVIPEPNHTKPATRKIARPFQIVEQIIRMLPSIDFHDQPRADADEIHDVIADRLLSAEAILAEMTVTQVTPEAAFRVGCVRA